MLTDAQLQKKCYRALFGRNFSFSPREQGRSRPRQLPGNLAMEVQCCQHPFLLGQASRRGVCVAAEDVEEGR